MPLVTTPSHTSLVRTSSTPTHGGLSWPGSPATLLQQVGISVWASAPRQTGFGLLLVWAQCCKAGQTPAVPVLPWGVGSVVLPWGSPAAGGHSSRLPSEDVALPSG